MANDGLWLRLVDIQASGEWYSRCSSSMPLSTDAKMDKDGLPPMKPTKGALEIHSLPITHEKTAAISRKP